MKTIRNVKLVNHVVFLSMGNLLYERLDIYTSYFDQLFSLGSMVVACYLVFLLFHNLVFPSLC